ncbi:MAG: c-type cytochrome [Polyangiaceae bacterium]
MRTVSGVALAATLVLGCRASSSTSRAEGLDASPLPSPTPADDVVVAVRNAELRRDVERLQGRARFTDDAMEKERALYLDDRTFRRETMVATLTNPTNTYARQRIASYGLGTRGWDALPEWNPRSVPVTAAVASALVEGRPVELPADASPLWDGVRPTTAKGWIELGERVFFGYPLRREVFLEWAIRRPEIAKSVGVTPAADGSYPGARVFQDDEGKAAIGLTCAICHTRVVDGVLHVGEARREFDYGRLRLLFHADTKTPVTDDLARRMRSWGPGRADVTEDDDEDPVAIPDLWGLREQSFLTQAGTLRHVGPTVLALRQETQLLHSNHQRVRPPRELAWALASYLYSLVPPPKTDIARTDTSAGKALFGEHCASCHSNAAFGGDPVPAERVGTDDKLANGRARGTGKYRPPALLAVRSAAPYFHHGAVATLGDVLDPARLSPEFSRGTLGKGAVPGHPFGTELSKKDRGALIVYLQSL